MVLLTQYRDVLFVIGLLIVLLLFLRLYFKNRKTSTPKITKLPFEIETLVFALGGRDNIVGADASQSKVKVELVNANDIIKEDLAKLGATGVVQTRQGVTLIFGQASELIASALNAK